MSTTTTKPVASKPETTTTTEGTTTMSTTTTKPAASKPDSTPEAELSALTIRIVGNLKDATALKGDEKARGIARAQDAAMAAYSNARESVAARGSRVTVLTVRKERGEEIRENLSVPSINVLRSIATRSPVQGSARLA
jgi:hypothetical protein